MRDRGHILVADDEQAFRAVAAEALRRAGFTCSEAADAVEALDVLQRETIDVLVSDINMPGNQGLELVRRLAADDDAPPIVLMTGQPSVSTAAAAVGLPVRAYLIKPFEQREMIAALDSAVRYARTRRSLNQQIEQLAGWQDRLSAIREVLRVRDDSAGAQQLQASMSVEQILSGVLALRDLGLDASAPSNPAAEPGDDVPNSRQLLAALRQTVEVLERTKTAFKSKELGQLRQRIELLLQDS